MRLVKCEPRHEREPAAGWDPYAVWRRRILVPRLMAEAESGSVIRVRFGLRTEFAEPIDKGSG